MDTRADRTTNQCLWDPGYSGRNDASSNILPHGVLPLPTWIGTTPYRCDFSSSIHSLKIQFADPTGFRVLSYDHNVDHAIPAFCFFSWPLLPPYTQSSKLAVRSSLRVLKPTIHTHSFPDPPLQGFHSLLRVVSFLLLLTINTRTSCSNTNRQSKDWIKVSIKDVSISAVGRNLYTIQTYLEMMYA